MFSVGRLLVTERTKRWTRQQKEEAHDLENRMLFWDFHWQDEGRSRRFIHKFNSPGSAKEAEKRLNELVVTSNWPGLESELKSLAGEEYNLRDIGWILNNLIKPC